jgi:hypothetical protein
MNKKNPTVTFSIKNDTVGKIYKWTQKNTLSLIVFCLLAVSISVYIYFYLNGLGLKYNDARSHLDIGRRIVEGLKPGLAQMGSVWLPLPHVLMMPTIWNDFMWHSGLSGALVSMISFITTGVLIYFFLKELNVGVLGRVFAVILFASNINVLYLQSTAMTELLLIATMTAGSYFFMLWAKTDNFLYLIESAFFVMLSSLTRYDGWFLFAFIAFLIAVVTFSKGWLNYRANINAGIKDSFNKIILYATLAGFGIALWFLWNLLIFNDPLYFIFGPFSAHAQQTLLQVAGELDTKFNLGLSAKFYLYALLYNSYVYTTILGLAGLVTIWFSNIKKEIKIALLALVAPLLFNILALYLGHSVLFIQGLSGNTWFNVRYGVMLLPAIAVFSGFLVDKFKNLRWVLIGVFAFTTFFTFASGDAVTIDDAKIGSSQKNVTEVAGWLSRNTKDEKGYILISAASHDAIIFSSGLPMKRFIHEGTGLYWESAISTPDRWARWIVMRTYDDSDLVWKNVSRTKGFQKYHLVETYPFATIYELDDQYLNFLITTPVFGKQK